MSYLIFLWSPTRAFRAGELWGQVASFSDRLGGASGLALRVVSMLDERDSVPSVVPLPEPPELGTPLPSSPLRGSASDWPAVGAQFGLGVFLPSIASIFLSVSSQHSANFRYSSFTVGSVASAAFWRSSAALALQISASEDTAQLHWFCYGLNPPIHVSRHGNDDNAVDRECQKTFSGIINWTIKKNVTKIITPSFAS